MTNITTHQDDHTEQLLRLNLARQDLQSANSIRQVQAVRQHAESIRTHAIRAALGIELQNLAAELKLQAERLGGQILSELRLRGGDRHGSQRNAKSQRLCDLGIDKNQSSRWQLEATVPEVTFRDFVRSLHAKGEGISSAALLRIAKDLKDQRDQVGRQNRTPPSEPTPVSVQSHLLQPETLSINPLRRDVAQLSELVTEVQHHHEVLSHLVDSICQRASITIQSTDYRAAQRYLAEITIHLRDIACGLKRIRREAIFMSPGCRAASI